MINITGTFVTASPTFGLAYATDLIGGNAQYANETAIGAIATSKLVVGEEQFAQGTGIKYVLASLTPGNGFANGNWQPISYTTANGSFTAVALVATSNIPLSGSQTIDGVSSGTKRILVTGQTTTSQNGLYDANTTGAWTRCTDADTAAEILVGKTVAVTSGTANTGSIWICNAAPTTLGTDPIGFVENSPAGATFNPHAPGPLGDITPSSIQLTTLAFAPGNWPGCGEVVHNFASDADFVLANTETSNGVIQIGGSANVTPNRKVGVRLAGQPGSAWKVQNLSASPFLFSLWDPLSSNFTGAAVQIPIGATREVWTDTTDMFDGSSSPVFITPVKTSAVTLATNCIFKCDPTATGSFTATMPAPGSEGEKIVVHTLRTDDTHTVTLSATGVGVVIRNPWTGATATTLVLNRTGTFRIEYVIDNAGTKTWVVY